MAALDELLQQIADGGRTRTDPLRFIGPKLSEVGSVRPPRTSPLVAELGPEFGPTRADMPAGRPPRTEPLRATRTPVVGGAARTEPIRFMGPRLSQVGPDTRPMLGPGRDILAGLSDDVAGAAGGGRAAGLAGMVSKIPKQFPGKLNSGLGKGGLGLGLGLGGEFLGEAAGGNDSIIGRFLKGAGTGGGLGALGGPKGAVIGGLVGGVGNALFGGGDGPDPAEAAQNQLEQVLAQATFDDDDREYFSLMFQVLEATTGDPQTALAQVGQAMMERMDSRESAEQQQQNMLEMQAVTAEYFAPYTQSILDSARQRASITERLAEDLPENYRSLALADSAASLDSASKVAAAYATQTQLLPMLQTMQSQQGMLDQAAQSLYSQGLQGALQGGVGGVGGGGGGLAELLAQMQQGQ